MPIPLRITFRNIPPSEFVEARIREKAEKLSRFHERITDCHVTIEVPHRHQHKGVIYKVNVDLTLPGGEIVVNRSPAANHSHEDVYVALRDAFDAAVRQLEDRVRRRRGDVKSHPPSAAQGRITRLFRDDGYGFIETADGLEVYFHENSLIDVPIGELDVGREVRFTMAETESEKGPQATSVHPGPG